MVHNGRASTATPLVEKPVPDFFEYLSPNVAVSLPAWLDLASVAVGGLTGALVARERRLDPIGFIGLSMLCGLGGIVGILVGTVCSVVLSKNLVQMTIYPALWVTLAAFGLSVLLGVVFGIYPAAKASKLQPVEALRAE